MRPERRSISRNGKGFHKPARSAEAGFTLIEVLVAFTIATIMLVALMQGMGRGLRSIDAASQQQMLVDYAQNHLQAVGVTIPLAPGVYQGEEPDHRWRIELSQNTDSLETGDIAGGQLQLLKITIEVFSADETEFSLTSFRLGDGAQ
ncbi:hypothetical protein GCM10007972_03140 [Iodidimonas muriae]|uniref:Type II secretion system protein GspI n=1 Tax=Iodidimonas muriae TaxID=261467 RepID=A0ABQ2L9J0_9PROT|nr:prepilin-type N-terminal cleavage/methylation domain-containing protein [Iodidimonas muriae]GER06638.1 hypothetical protein JCM17843_09480 [Kordiimonadales bacterium JCM 17843]GGO05594.1 hypothetical protein GCM10007972_03140 [Iodidimonas muriae]